MEFKNGMIFRAAENSDTPNVTIEIIETGLKDEAGFDAVKIKFNDGTIEIAATDSIAYGISTGMKQIN